MAQYRCDLCGAEFDTRSEYRRHMQTSHPAQAPSAADLEHALSGIEYPATPDALAEHARSEGQDEIAGILQQLPDQEYRDAAEVARAFGSLRSHEDKPDYQPSVRGGAAALEAPSAARFASLFTGLRFPASPEDLQNHASPEASEDEMKTLRRLPDRTYRDMSDLAEAYGEIKQDHRG